MTLRETGRRRSNTHSVTFLVAYKTLHIINVEAEDTLDGIDSVGRSRSISSVIAAVISLPCIP